MEKASGTRKLKAEDEQMKVELTMAREQCYVEPGEVVSLTLFFALPMEMEEDVRMVYDGTKLGLNENSSYALWFSLPTMYTHFRPVDGSTFMSNMDIGKCTNPCRHCVEWL
jgi:hypothetical protein